MYKTFFDPHRTERSGKVWTEKQSSEHWLLVNTLVDFREAKKRNSGTLHFFLFSTRIKLFWGGEAPLCTILSNTHSLSGVTVFLFGLTTQQFSFDQKTLLIANHPSRFLVYIFFTLKNGSLFICLIDVLISFQYSSIT